VGVIAVELIIKQQEEAEMEKCRKWVIVSAALTGVAFGAIAADAERTVRRKITRTNAAGESRTVTKESRWQRQDGKWIRDTTRTGAKGGQVTSHSELVKTGEGSWERNTTVTGPKGNQVQGKIVGQKTEDGYTKTGTWTDAQGRTHTRDVDFSYDKENKSWKKSVTATGPDGQTRSKEITGQKTENGYTRNSTMTNAQGKTMTREAQGTWDPATKTWQKNMTAIGPEGKTYTRQTTGQKTEDGYAATTTATGPQGKQKMVNSQGVWDPATKTWKATHTDNQGNTVEKEVTIDNGAE
jgi:hypothetical protein